MRNIVFWDQNKVASYDFVAHGDGNNVLFLFFCLMKRDNNKILVAMTTKIAIYRHTLPNFLALFFCQKKLFPGLTPKKEYFSIIREAIRNLYTEYEAWTRPACTYRFTPAHEAKNH